MGVTANAMVFVFIAFGVAFLAVAVLVARRAPVNDVDDFIVAGRRLPFGVVSASVMVSWLWTTSLLGAAEAGYLFGIGGGFAFAFGSAVPFFLFIPLALRLRRIMPAGTTFLEFIHQRYGKTTHHLLLGLTLLLALYICVEQILGIGYAVSGSYDVPYSAVVIGASIVVVGYIAIAGLRGAVINDVIQFVIISAVSLVLIPVVLATFGIDRLYDGLKHAAENPNAAVHTPDALNFWGSAAVQYFAVALVVSMGFVLLNQGYYSKARAAGSNRSLMRAYVVGTVLAWIPIPILFGVLGGIGIADGLTVGDELRVTTDVAGHVFGEYFGTVGSLLFSLTIFMAGLTTAGNSLAGFQAAVAVDVHHTVLGRRSASDAARKRFTQVATVVFGVAVTVGALLLEGHSLLRIDILSGIVFAAPIGALVAGMVWARPNGVVAIGSIAAGLVCGITSYLMIDDPELNYFIGNLASLLVPFAVVAVAGWLTRREFAFDSLRNDSVEQASDLETSRVEEVPR